MDLYAYAQIADYEDILKANDIVIKRLRGIRMMKEEEAVPEEEILEMIEEEKLHRAVDYLRNPLFNFYAFNLTKERRDNRKKAFIIKNVENKYTHEIEPTIVGIDLSKVHGKHRKKVKFIYKQATKAYRTQYDMFNSFVGKDVMMVHARQGGGNRDYYPIDTNHPMYLCDCDDAWDETYCDIYYDLTKAKQQ